MEDGKVRALILGDAMATGMVPLTEALFRKRIFKRDYQPDFHCLPCGYDLLEVIDGVWDGQIQEIGNGHMDGGCLAGRIQCPLRNPDYEFTIGSCIGRVGMDDYDYVYKGWDAIVVAISSTHLLGSMQLMELKRLFMLTELNGLFFVVNCSGWKIEEEPDFKRNVSAALESQLTPILSDENGEFDRDLFRKHIFFVNTWAAMELRTISSPSEAREYEEKAKEDFWRYNEIDFPQFEEALYFRLEQALYEKKKRNREKSAVFDSKPDAFDKNSRKSFTEEGKTMENGKARVLVAGGFGTGKSSLLNALFRKKILNTPILPDAYGRVEITDGSWDGQIQVAGSYDFTREGENTDSYTLKGRAKCPLRNPDYEFTEISMRVIENLGWKIPGEWDVMVMAISAVYPLTKKEEEFIKRFCTQTEQKNLFFVITFSDCLNGDSETTKAVWDFIKNRLVPILSHENDEFDRNLLKQHIFFVNSRAAMELRTISSPSEAREYEEKAQEDFWRYNEMDFPRFEEALYFRLEQMLHEKKKGNRAKTAVSEPKTDAFVENSPESFTMAVRKGGEMNAEKYIGFINETLESMKGFFIHDRGWYQEEIKKVRRRAKDPYLNMALIGDFSSGKSTFINALIKRDLLKTAWTATTAVPTHIYPGNKTGMSVVVKTTDRLYDLNKESSRRAFGEKLGKNLPKEETELIAFLSTSNEITGYVKDIFIHVPVETDFEKICIIDTPGVNPGASGTESHVKATQNVLRENADAAIVLFKATQVYTGSFERFLKENAEHLMDEAVFVITFFDLIDEDERDEMKEYVEDRIRSSFGIQKPLVYCCSAKYANHGDGGEEEKMWSDSFDKLRTELAGYIGWRRDVILRKQMVFLLGGLITEIEKEVQENMDRIKKQLAILEANSVENMEHELVAMGEDHLETMKWIYQGIGPEVEYDNMFYEMKKTAARKINACTQMYGGGGIEDYIKNYLPQDIKKIQSDTSESLTASFGRLAKENQAYYEKCERLFHRYNMALGEIREDRDIRIEDTSLNQDIKIAYINGFGMGETTLLLAASLASLPLLLPLAILNEMLGGGSFEKKAADIANWMANLPGWIGGLEKNKAKASSQVSDKLEKARTENKAAFLAEMESNRNKLFHAAEEIKEGILKEYRRIYEEKMRQYEIMRRRLEQEIKEYEQIHVKTRKYLSELEKERKEANGRTEKV